MGGWRCIMDTRDAWRYVTGLELSLSETFTELSCIVPGNSALWPNVFLRIYLYSNTYENNAKMTWNKMQGDSR